MRDYIVPVVAAVLVAIGFARFPNPKDEAGAGAGVALGKLASVK